MGIVLLIKKNNKNWDKLLMYVVTGGDMGLGAFWRELSV